MKSHRLAIGALVSLFFGSVLVVQDARAGTTRMDNESYAIRPAATLAIKQGDKWILDRSATLGMRGDVFRLDGGSAPWVPPACRQLFASKVMKAGTRVPFTKLPVATLLGSEGQMLALEGKDCVARVWFTWLASFGSIPDDVLNKVKIKDPGTPSIVFGLIQFTSNGNKTTIEFVVGADDV
jgi:hypothetical protein